jgi:hypothetical protein
MSVAAMTSTPPGSPARPRGAALADAAAAPAAVRAGGGGAARAAAGGNNGGSTTNTNTAPLSPPSLQPRMSRPPGAVRLEGWAFKGTRLSDALVVRRWLRLCAGGRLASCRARGARGAGSGGGGAGSGGGGAGSGGGGGSGGSGGGGGSAADGAEFSPAAETRAWQLHRGCRLEPEVWPADGDAGQESDQQQQASSPPQQPAAAAASSSGGGGGGGGSPSQQQVPPPQRKVERPRGRWTVTAKVMGGGDPVDLVSFFFV